MEESIPSIQTPAVSDNFKVEKEIGNKVSSENFLVWLNGDEITLPKTPENRPKAKRKGSSSKHPFSGAMVLRRVYDMCILLLGKKIKIHISLGCSINTRPSGDYLFLRGDSKPLNLQWPLLLGQPGS